jgi:uncharacterized sodium:solute symporter family permease YidK
MKTDLVNYHIPKYLKNELTKISGIDQVTPCFDKSLNLTIDLWFNKDWNTEIKPILLHLKAIQNFKIYSLKIVFRIKNIHIKLQHNNC